MDNSLNNPSASGSTQVPRRFVARHRRLSNDDVARFIHRPNRIENHRQGYPRLSAFINSDRNFALFRGFGQLQARVLLHMQDELAHLEQRLNDLDNNERIAFNLSSSRQDSNGARRGVLTELKSKLEKYSKTTIVRLTLPDAQDTRSSDGSILYTYRTTRPPEV
ncbi:hypothetical protein EV356DRAFT_509977 [Viridothelium virens]|uniref:DUF6594 domain-containing protein n=1 Tax=Viridothelium virens TaxID=1048519 RepID=A0A6A6GX36_VIRVR|nr:hypothetical protein EV356DRAFT_509977 [Viridothelium virens]